MRYVYPVLWTTSYWALWRRDCTAASSLQYVHGLTPLLRGTGCLMSHDLVYEAPRLDEFIV